MKKTPTNANKNYNTYFKYTALGTQLLVSIGITAWLGQFIDKKKEFSKPLFVWILPLFVLIGSLIKIIKDTQKK